MSPRRNWAAQVQSAGRQLQAHLHTARARVRTGLLRGRPFARPVITLMVLLVLVSGPAIAPPSNGNGGGDGSGIVQEAVCESEMSTLGSAVFTLLILVLSAFGVYRIGNGFRKYGDPRSDVKREGIESIKGGLLSFVGAIFVLVSPDLLTKLGLNFSNCISVAGI